MRQHGDDGISQEACAVIIEHGLDRDAVLGWADRYAAKEGVDFNQAPAQDFENAPIGRNLVAKIRGGPPVFELFRNEFKKALHDYSVPDDIISRCLVNGVIVDRAGRDMYGRWKQYAERLEGLNVALYRAAKGAIHLHRFIADLAELSNYQHGRWRKEGNVQDRVPTTVGASNFLLEGTEVAKITYDVSALRGWIQPVRYSPYPRKQRSTLERFGDEKDGHFAGEGEVHVHVGCPIPARKYIKIELLSPSSRGRQDVIDQYGDVGIVQ